MIFWHNMKRENLDDSHNYDSPNKPHEFRYIKQDDLQSGENIAISGDLSTNLICGDPRYKEPTGNFTIFELDEKITKLISQPELGKGDELYQAVYTLHLELLEIHDVFNWHRDCPKSLALGKEIVKRSGLNIFKTFINEESLKDVYKYNNAQVYEIVDLITNCERLYNSSEPIIKQGEVN